MSIRSSGNTFIAQALAGNGTHQGIAEPVPNYGSASVVVVCDQTARLDLFGGPSVSDLTLTESLPLVQNQKVTHVVSCAESFFKIAVVSLSATAATVSAQTYYFDGAFAGGTQKAANASLSSIDSKLPAALDAGSLKVAIQSGSTPAITGFATETTTAAMSAKITTGQDVKVAGAGLQQVLVYGRKSDGTLQPLECNGDRLLVDVVELAASGRVTTSSALSSQQVCGFDLTTAQFKTLLCDSSGHQIVTPAAQTSEHYVLFGTAIDTTEVAASSTTTGSQVDVEGYSEGTFVGSWTGTFVQGADKVAIEISNDGASWFFLLDVFVDTANGNSIHTFQRLTAKYVRAKVTNSHASPRDCQVLWLSKR